VTPQTLANSLSQYAGTVIGVDEFLSCFNRQYMDGLTALYTHEEKARQTAKRILERVEAMAIS